MNRDHRSTRTKALAPFVVLVLALAGNYGVARADQAPGVARLSSIAGTVTIGTDTSGATQAQVNMPVLPGQYITTAVGSRAEVQLDYADALRADENTQLRFTNLDGIGDTAQLAAGTVELRVLERSRDHALIETPSVTVRPTQAGAYLVTVAQDGSTRITVRSGDAQIVTPGGTQELLPGRTMLASGNANDPVFTYIATAPYDGFEQWNDELDRQLAQTGAYQYVNQAVIGANDLDMYGSWNYISGYGECWHPNEDSNWAPYQDGTWITNNYYGPTWIGYEPWGWAPYHYGRWFYDHQVGWAWDPGPRVVRPLWSPALVGFFGFNVGGVHATIGTGNVGWIPLAPGEAFHPWWGSRYNTTIVNNNYTRIVNNNPGWQRRYANFRAPHAISGVTLATWNQGNVRHIVSFNPQQIRGGRAVPGAPRIVHVQAAARNQPRTFVPVTRAVERTAPAAPGWRTFDSARTGAPQQPRMQHFTRSAIAPGHHLTTTQTRSYNRVRTYDAGRSYPTQVQSRQVPSRQVQARTYPIRQRTYQPSQRTYQPSRHTYQPVPRQTVHQAPQRAEQRTSTPPERQTYARPNPRPSARPNGG
ncbi:MAG: DUF6600 domain-containing protein [Vulcanimicrobiaceae bacterium]